MIYNDIPSNHLSLELSNKRKRDDLENEFLVKRQKCISRNSKRKIDATFEEGYFSSISKKRRVTRTSSSRQLDIGRGADDKDIEEIGRQLQVLRLPASEGQLWDALAIKILKSLTSKDIRNLHIAVHSLHVNNSQELIPHSMTRKSFHTLKDKITTLDLSNMNDLCDEDLTFIAQFTRLKELNLSNCLNITDHGVAQLLTKSASLKTVVRG